MSLTTEQIANHPELDVADAMAEWEHGDQVRLVIRRDSFPCLGWLIEQVNQEQLAVDNFEELEAILRRRHWFGAKERKLSVTLTRSFSILEFMMATSGQLDSIQIIRRRPLLDINSVLDNDDAKVRFRFKDEAAEAITHALVVLRELHDQRAVVINQSFVAEMSDKLAEGDWSKFDCHEAPRQWFMTSNLASNPAAMATFLQKVVPHLELLRS